MWVGLLNHAVGDGYRGYRASSEDRIEDAATSVDFAAEDHRSFLVDRIEDAAAGPLGMRASQRSPEVFSEEVEVDFVKAEAERASGSGGPAQETVDVLEEAEQLQGHRQKAEGITVLRLLLRTCEM